MKFLKYGLFLFILFVFLYTITARGIFGSLPKDGQISEETRPVINLEITEEKQIFFWRPSRSYNFLSRRILF